MAIEGRMDGRLVAGNARDQRDPRNPVSIELRHPAVGELLDRPWIVPAKPMGYCPCALFVWEPGDAGGQQLEEVRGEEMTVRVTDPHANAIIIGLVSDTHGLIRDSLLEALAGVSQILHAGDVGGRSVLDALSTIAPVEAVYGNVDPLDGMLPQHVHVEHGGLSIHVSHGHELGPPTPHKLLARYNADVLVYGHTHKALVYREGDRLVVNPGAAGPRRFDLTPSVARLTIVKRRAEVEIVNC